MRWGIFLNIQKQRKPIPLSDWFFAVNYFIFSLIVTMYTYMYLDEDLCFWAWCLQDPEVAWGVTGRCELRKVGVVRKELVSLSETLNSVWDKNISTLEFYLPSWKSGLLVKCLHGVYVQFPTLENIYPPNIVFPKPNLPPSCFKRISSVLLFIPQVKWSSPCIANPTKAWRNFCPNTYRFVSKSFSFPLLGGSGRFHYTVEVDFTT